MSHLESRRVDPRQFHIGPLRTGDTLMDRSSLSRDEESQKGIRQAREVLSDSGLLILDAHRTWIDIVLSASRLTEELPIKRLIVAIAGKFRGGGFQSSMLKRINQQVDGAELMFVIREKDKRKHKGNNRSLNMRFLRASLDVLDRNNPNEAVLIAPYGGRTEYMNDVKEGAFFLLKRGYPTLFTLSSRSQYDNPLHVVKRHTLFVSPNVMSFDGQELQNINPIIRGQFADLERRAVIR